MEKKVKITIGQKLKKKLDWQILSKDKDYDSHIWGLVHLMESDTEAMEKYPKEMEKVGKIFKNRRRAFLKKEPNKSRNPVIRVFEE